MEIAAIDISSLIDQSTALEPNSSLAYFLSHFAGMSEAEVRRYSVRDTDKATE